MRRLFFCLMAMMGVLTLSAQSVCENEVINNIMTRTSIRQYTNEPVSKADIETMLRAGMAAPTAVNKQPWRVVREGSRFHFYEAVSLPPSPPIDMQRIDLGIGICHFHLAALEAGINGHFSSMPPKISSPEGTIYLTTFITE